MLLSDKVFDNFLHLCDVGLSVVDPLRQARVDIIDVFIQLLAEALELLCVLADLRRLLPDLHACAFLRETSVFAGIGIRSSVSWRISAVSLRTCMRAHAGAFLREKSVFAGKVIRNGRTCTHACTCGFSVFAGKLVHEGADLHACVHVCFRFWGQVDIFMCAGWGGLKQIVLLVESK